MAYEVIARKWRPQQFDDVVGQEHVTRTLKNAIESERVAHAYLFVGPRGIGKTSTARIFAKAMNCAKGPTPKPCDKCDSCREIMAGSSLDVIEIDGASNRGIDHIRDLRDNVRFVPARGPFKIYIIDEVHMLTIESFNALLKTLEEPPRHVKFVFATTEPQKVPPTILSRCQRFDLRPISTRLIVKRLGEIAAAEKVAVDEDALLAIARAAEGGLRDAESALDQIISFRGRKISEEDVMSVFGLTARRTLEELVGAVVKGDIPLAMRMVADFDEGGKDMQRVVLELLEYFRNILIHLCAGGEGGRLDLTEAQVEALVRMAQGTDPGRVLRIISILTEADQRLRQALSKRTLLEVALIRCARAATVASIDEILAELNRLKAALGGEGPADSVESVQAARPSPAQVRPPAPAAVRETRPAPAPAAPPVEPAAAEAAAGDGGAGDEVQTLSERWHEVVERVGHAAPLAKNYLLDAKPVKVEGGVAQIGFDPQFAADKEKIDFPRNRKALQNVLQQILGRPVSVEFSVLSAKDTLPGDIKVAKPGVDGKKKGAPLTGLRKMSQRAKEEWIRNPQVEKILESFNGDIVDIRE